MLLNKIVVMNARRIIFPAMLSVVVIFSACGDNATEGNDIKRADSPAVDSSMPAHVQDPSTAFPQPPVTGTQTDSTRTTDSAKKKGDTLGAKKVVGK
jgi:hypothetical protein